MTTRAALPRRSRVARSLGSLLALALLPACGAADAPTPAPADDSAAAATLACAPPVTVDARRSLAVTDLAIVNNTRFSLQRVLQTLVTSAGASNSALDVYQRLFDNDNPAPGAIATGHHCDDTRDAAGRPVLNGFPLECPRQEGALARRSPFCTGPGCDPFIPIGLFNRFDLAPSDGANCGEYRIIFGKRSEAVAPPPGDRALLIFEAVLPNPSPSCGLQACRPVADFWAKLSTMTSAADRAAALEQLYFNGLPGFAPVLRAAHFQSGAGQIRANQFMNVVAGQPWQLREYKLEPPAAPGGTLGARQVTVKSNPFAELFNPANSSTAALAFRDPQNPSGFVAQVDRLAVNDINGFAMSIDDTFNGGQSTSQPGPAPATHDSDYPFWLGGGPSALRTAIASRLTAIGSALTPQNIVDRAEALSCAGCHQLSNGRALGGGLVWPASQGFVHVSEVQQEPCNGGACWRVSPALANVFLPARKARLESFLNSTSCATCTAPAGTARAALSAAPTPARVH